jgi:DNA-directed RNA polymerase specialized sigma24 family protein
MARRTDPGEQLIDGLAIEKAMLMLPPGYRTAFILHDIEGYKHGEAARLSGHTVGTSKSQLHKARASLRAVLSKRSPALPREKSRPSLVGVGDSAEIDLYAIRA